MKHELAKILDQMLQAKGLTLRMQQHHSLHSAQVISNNLACYTYDDTSLDGAIAQAAYAELGRTLACSLILALNDRLTRANPKVWEAAKKLLDLLESEQYLHLPASEISGRLFEHRLYALIQAYLREKKRGRLDRDFLFVGFRVRVVGPVPEDDPSLYASAIGQSPAIALGKLALELIQQEEVPLCPVCGGSGRVGDSIPCWRCA